MEENKRTQRAIQLELLLNQLEEYIKLSADISLKFKSKAEKLEHFSSGSNGVEPLDNEPNGYLSKLSSLIVKLDYINHENITTLEHLDYLI